MAQFPSMHPCLHTSPNSPVRWDCWSRFKAPETSPVFLNVPFVFNWLSLGGGRVTHPCNWLPPSPPLLPRNLPWWSAASFAMVYSHRKHICLRALWKHLANAANVPHSKAQASRSSGLLRPNDSTTKELVFWQELCSILTHIGNDWPWSAHHSNLQHWAG